MPVNSNLKFKLSEEPQRHYYVFQSLFIDYDDALGHCDENSIPYEFIVKTHFYIIN